MRKFISVLALVGILLISIFSSCNQSEKGAVEGKKKISLKDSASVHESKKSKYFSPFWEDDHPVLLVGNTNYEVVERDFEKSNFEWFTIELNAPGLLNLTNDNPDKRLPQPKITHQFFVEFDATGKVIGFSYRLNGHNYGLSIDTLESGKIDTLIYGTGLYFCEVAKSCLVKKDPSKEYSTYIPEYSRKIMLWNLSKFPSDKETVYSATIEEALIKTGIPNLVEIYKAILAELSAARIEKKALK
jgi:hypothetical protein